MQKMHKASGCCFSCFIISLLSVFSSCTGKPAPDVSFYYWRTRFEINQYEKDILTQNKVRSLYVRYFDVDLDPATGTPRPVSTILIDSTIAGLSVIPVVYIKNRVFEKTDTNNINALSNNIFQVISAVNRENKITSLETQFDCDWTEKTKTAFFYFLTRYKKISNQELSATIRLHQVKYSQRTGIPPVDKGVLMFYNMGAISAGNINSIYERKNALKYVSSLKNYPLPLNIALPIFSWGIGSRGGKVRYLLNKMYIKDFEKDSSFTKLSDNRFKAKHSFFKSGYYIHENDEIKIETVGAGDLNGMVRMLKPVISRPLEKIIFYDLDSSNLINYESSIFQTISEDFR
jgi:hypothetical protein